jgi:hypothetical protein
MTAQILAAMERAFRAGHELGLLDCIVFCHEKKRTLPGWAFDALAERARDQATGKKPNRKMGRHALLFSEQDQLHADSQCFMMVNSIRQRHEEKDEDFFDKAAKELHLTPDAVRGDVFAVAARVFDLDRETVRKAYYRVRKKLASGSYYLSYLYRQDPAGFMRRVSLMKKKYGV